MNQLLNGVVVIVTAIIGVAILSVLVSKQSDTSNVLKSASGAFSGALGTALSPVTSGSGFSAYTGPSYGSFA
jgi:hypothetical protein